MKPGVCRGLAAFGLGVAVLAGSAFALTPFTPSARADGSEPLKAAATFTVLEDLAARVAGSQAAVSGLTPLDAEVHEWELTSRNFVDLEEADIVFYNGYGLEQWLSQAKAVAGGDARMVPLAERIERETIPIQIGELAGATDPHLWMDPESGKQYAEVIRDTLSEADPDNAEAYAENAAALIEEIEAARADAEQAMACIPEDARVLVTSETAFLYFSDAFGFKHTGIWGTNAEEEGTPTQMMRVIDTIRNQQPAAIFWESTISDRYVQSVSEDTGVPIAGPLYVDSLGPDGSGAESYTGMLRSNARLLRETLGQGCGSQSEEAQ